MRAILIAAALIWAPPVEAKCHRVWNYPWPQNCGSGYHSHYSYNHYHRSYRYGYSRSHYDYSPETVQTKVEKKEPPQAKPTVVPHPQEQIQEPCPHEGDYNQREYALCLTRLQLEIYYANKAAGVDNYKVMR